MVVLHSVDFTTITNIKSYLKQVPYWAYCVVNGSSIFARNLDDNEIYKRIYKNKKGYLEFMRRAEEQNKDGLRPRIELVPRILLPKNTNIHIRYEVSLIEGGSLFRGMIFQLMDRTVDTRTLPTFQFEMRYGRLHTRWMENLTTQRIHSIATPKWNVDEWHNLDVYAYLSSDEKKGYIRVHHNGKRVWEYKGRCASQATNKIQIQYGIYAVAGVKLRTQVRKLEWETI